MRFDQLQYLASYGTARQLPASTQKEIVFSGRSNVGKSSLINKLFNRKTLARVSSVPGKTVTVNFFRGDGALFVDLPGYGYARREKSERQRWAELMEGFFQSERRIALVVQLIDMRHPPSADDETMLQFLQARGIPFVIVLTKADKLNQSETAARRAALQQELAAYADAQVIEFSAVKGTGVEELKAVIAAAAE